MKFEHHHHHAYDTRLEARLRAMEDQLDLIVKGITTMATKEQLDKLRVDVAALIDEAVKDITEAVKEAQDASTDPAIDELDKSVTDTTQALKDAASKLRNPPAG